MKGIIYLFLLTTFLFSGCGIRERETVLQKKEAELAQKEQELSLKTEALRLKEEELVKKEQRVAREQRVDSTEQDTASTYNPQVLGKWSVRMTCIESTCPGSAVGDTKYETWELSSQNNQVIAQAIADAKLVRVYSGTYKNNVLELTEDVALSPSAPATKMLVRLTLLNESTLEGQREIVRSGDCKIVYALQLSKQVAS